VVLMGTPIGEDVDRGERRINAGDAIATIAVYRIDNSFMLMGRLAPLRAPGEIMSTRAMFEGHIEDAFVANPDAPVDAPAGTLPGTRPLHLELSLHHDLDSIENDWRAF
jgi:hypothetical protein